jgi:hypothetical protein
MQRLVLQGALLQHAVPAIRLIDARQIHDSMACRKGQMVRTIQHVLRPLHLACYIKHS